MGLYVLKLLLLKQSALRPVYDKDVMIEAFVASLTSLSD